MDGLMEVAEEQLREAVGLLVAVVEAAGAVVIAVGAVWAFGLFLRASVQRRGAEAFVPIRLTLGRFLALGLGFQLASDVLARRWHPASARSASSPPSPRSARR